MFKYLPIYAQDQMKVTEQESEQKHTQFLIKDLWGGGNCFL